MVNDSEALTVALINLGLSLNAVNFYGETPLMSSIVYQKYQLIGTCLLKYGKTLDLNIQDHQGKTLLHWAVIKKATSIIEKLLELGANPDIKTNKGESPLQLAFANEYFDGISILYKARPNTNLNLLSRGDGGSALHMAVKIQSTWMVKLCLDHGLKINCPDIYATTPLHIAIEKKNFEIIEILLKSDKSRNIVNISDTNGKTFLHRAVEGGDLKLVKCLVEYGALIHIYDGNGKTPIDLAEEKNFKKISFFLKRPEKSSRLEIIRNLFFLE